jgi:hypothetical protein
VKFVDWFPYYQGIRAEFGYSSEKDQEAAKMLSDMAKKKAMDPKILERKIRGKNVVVIGAGSGLEDERAARFIKKNKSFVTIAADGAVQFLLENKIKPDIVVTDLDGDPASLQKAEKAGATMVVHAHGDNTGLLKKLVPKFRCHRLKTFTILAALRMETGASSLQMNLALERLSLSAWNWTRPANIPRQESRTRR